MGSRTSPYLQEKLVLLATNTVFADVETIIESLLGIQTNQAQTYRICQELGAALPTDQLKEPSPALRAQLAQDQTTVYGLVDGSMLFTETGWQETKVGRLFTAQPEEKATARPTLDNSEYVAHRGHYQEFTPAFEQLLPPDSAARKVFVTDGAVWIGTWLSATYPNATHILDYFHVVEKLAFAVKGLPEGASWLAQQEAALLTDQSQEVETNVARLTRLGALERSQLVGYLINNRDRMRYGTYRKAGLLIGSGPIEAAHRSVLQVRMKRSGQRWVDRGCDHMVRLRVAYKSNKFGLVTDLLKSTTAKI